MSSDAAVGIPPVPSVAAGASIAGASSVGAAAAAASSSGAPQFSRSLRLWHSRRTDAISAMQELLNAQNRLSYAVAAPSAVAHLGTAGALLQMEADVSRRREILRSIQRDMAACIQHMATALYTRDSNSSSNIIDPNRSEEGEQGSKQQQRRRKEEEGGDTANGGSGGVGAEGSRANAQVLDQVQQQFALELCIADQLCGAGSGGGPDSASSEALLACLAFPPYLPMDAIDPAAH